MRRIILESPYASPIPSELAANITYAKLCAKDSLGRGESPLLSHLLYPGILDDNDPFERQLGIDAGLAWGVAAEATVVYTDRGVSKGMEYGIANAKKAGRKIEFRSLYV